jgi:hypothetical protein
MTLSIANMAVSMGSEVYWDEDWHVTLESLLLFLMNSNNSQTIQIDPHDAYKYEGDLWSLLQAYNQPPQYFWPIMRANGMYSPTELTRDVTSLIIPAATFIEQIRQLYQTVSQKLN